VNSHWLASLCDWLAATSVSQAIQTTAWVIPAVQTTHILAVAVVITAVVMTDLRLLGVAWRDQALDEMVGRFLPSLWWALLVLAVTGGILIVGEPGRSLRNPVFALKMGLLVLATGVTLVCQIPLRTNRAYWDLSVGRRRLARLLAGTSLPLWIAVIFSGRWIAYVQGS